MAWHPPGTRPPANTYNYDFQHGWQPPGALSNPSNLQYSMQPGEFPGSAGPSGDWHMLVSPPGTQAPPDLMNYTPASQEMSPPGMQAPSQQMNLSVVPPQAGLSAIRSVSQQPLDPQDNAQRIFEALGLGAVFTGAPSVNRLLPGVAQGPAAGMGQSSAAGVGFGAGQGVGVGAGTGDTTDPNSYQGPFSDPASMGQQTPDTSVPPVSADAPPGVTNKSNPLAGLGDPGAGQPTRNPPQPFRLVTERDGSVWQVNEATGEYTQVQGPSPQPTRLAGGDQLIDPTNGKVLATNPQTYAPSQSQPRSAQVVNSGTETRVFSPDGQLIASYPNDQKPQVSAIGGGQYAVVGADGTIQIQQAPHQYGASDYLSGPNGSQYLIDPKTGQATQAIGPQTPIQQPFPFAMGNQEMLYDPSTKQANVIYTQPNHPISAFWQDYMHKADPSLYPTPQGYSDWNQAAGIPEPSTGKGQDFVGVGGGQVKGTTLTPSDWNDPTITPGPPPFTDTSQHPSMGGAWNPMGLAGDITPELDEARPDYSDIPTGAPRRPPGDTSPWMRPGPNAPGRGQATGVGAQVPPLNPGDVVGSGHHFGEPVSMEGIHKGTDLQAYQGTPVYSPVHGFIHSIEYDPAGLGLQVHIQSHDGSVHTLAHLQDHFVREGDPVSAGDHIASVGSTGAGSTGPHLDYRTQDAQGNYTNPEPSLGGLSQLPRADDGSEPGEGQDVGVGGPWSNDPDTFNGISSYGVDSAGAGAGGHAVRIRIGGLPGYQPSMVTEWPQAVPMTPDDLTQLPGKGQDVGVGDAASAGSLTPALSSTGQQTVMNPFADPFSSNPTGAYPTQVMSGAGGNTYGMLGSPISNMGDTSGLGQYDPYMLNPYMQQSQLPTQNPSGGSSQIDWKNERSAYGISANDSTPAIDSQFKSGDPVGSASNPGDFSTLGQPALDPANNPNSGTPDNNHNLGTGQAFGVGATSDPGGGSTAPPAGGWPTGTDPNNQPSGAPNDWQSIIAAQQEGLNSQYLNALMGQMTAQQQFNNQQLGMQMQQIQQSYQFHGDAQRYQQEALIAENQWRQQDRQLQASMNQLNQWTNAMVNTAYNNPWLQELSGMTPGYGQPGGPGWGPQPYGKLGPPGNIYNPQPASTLWNANSSTQRLTDLYGAPPNPGSFNPNGPWTKGRTDLQFWNTPAGGNLLGSGVPSPNLGGSNPTDPTGLLNGRGPAIPPNPSTQQPATQNGLNMPAGGNGGNGNGSQNGARTPSLAGQNGGGSSNGAGSYATGAAQPYATPWNAQGAAQPAMQSQSVGSQMAAPGAQPRGSTGPSGMSAPGQPSSGFGAMPKTPIGSTQSQQGITYGGQGTGGPIEGHTSYGNPIYTPQAVQDASPFQRAAARTDVALTGEPFGHYTMSSRDLWGATGGPTQMPGTTQMEAQSYTPLDQINRGQEIDISGQNRDAYWNNQQRQWSGASQPNVYQKA